MLLVLVCTSVAGYFVGDHMNYNAGISAFVGFVIGNSVCSAYNYG
jgi:hypothetical protein